MGTVGFPTSSDIYLEADGRKIAVVQSYKATARRSEQVVEAFGESEPVATIATQLTYKLELTRLYATAEAVAEVGGDLLDLTDTFSNYGSTTVTFPA